MYEKHHCKVPMNGWPHLTLWISIITKKVNKQTLVKKVDMLLDRTIFGQTLSLLTCVLMALTCYLNKSFIKQKEHKT